MEAWASFKSFKPKADASPPSPDDGPPRLTGRREPERDERNRDDGRSRRDDNDDGREHPKTEIGRNAERDWRGHAWSNATHASVTDPDARLYRKAKGKPAQLCYMGHALTENRNGFVFEAGLTHADGTAERRAAIDMLNT